MSFEKKIAVVLVTYNRVELLKLAINSLREQLYPVEKIIVVNNFSNDGTKDYLESDQTILSYHMEYNAGGAGGFNKGIEIASNLDVDYIWVMDDDAIATSNALLELVEATKVIKKDWGFICSKVISDDGIFMSGPILSNKKNISGYSNWAEYGEFGLIGVDKCSFVSFFTKKEHVINLGLPVKEMFIWGDDTEYSWRMSNKLDCYIACKSMVYHKRMDATSLNIVSEQNTVRLSWYFYLYRNTFYNIKTHGRKLKLLTFTMRCFLDVLKVLFNSKDRKVKRVSLILKGFISGLKFSPKIDFPQ